MPSLFDVNNYKGKIESLVLSKTNNVLKINGDINLSILYGLNLVVKDISFKSQDGEKLFDSKELILAPKFLPLLKGNLLFDSISIVEPNIYITKKKNIKKYNWEIAFQKKNKDTEAKENKTKVKEIRKSKKINPLNINSLNISDANIFIKVNGKKDKFDKINFKLDYEDNNQYLIKGDIIYNEEKLDFYYDLKYSDSEANIIGNIKGKSLVIKNNTSINVNTLKGNSKLSMKVIKLSSFLKQNYLKNQSLEVDANLAFTGNSIKINKARISNNDNIINLDGNYLKKNKRNYLTLNLKTDKLSLDKLLYIETNSKKSKEKKLENKKKNNSVINDEKHLIDIIFDKLNSYDIKANFLANEMKIYKETLNNVNIEFNKKKDLDIFININDNFLKNTKAKSKIMKNKTALFSLSIESLKIEKINQLTGFNKLSGILGLSIDGKTNLSNKKSILKELNGVIKANTNNVKINKLNLKALKSNIININNINALLNLNNDVFKGNTSLKNQDIFIKIVDGNLKLKKTNIFLEENKISAEGFYKLETNEINLGLNYNDYNELLSLFKIRFKGNIKNINTTLDYEKEKADNIIEKMLEKKMKKIIKDKLDSKFNNIIDNLLD